MLRARGRDMTEKKGGRKESKEEMRGEEKREIGIGT